MASDDKVVEPLASALSDTGTMSTVSEMVKDDMSLDGKNQSPISSLSQGQINGSAGPLFKSFLSRPPDLTYAKVQGLAKLRQILNDPDGEIAEIIRKTSGFNQVPASNGRCKKVQHLLTGAEKASAMDKSVPFILATWCMLGGEIPTMWRERREGEKAGSRDRLTAWGKKMLVELRHLGSRNKYDFEICKAYATREFQRAEFNNIEFLKELEKLDDDAKSTKEKPTPNTKPVSLGKHVASSPRQSPAAKRQKTVAFERTQQSGGYHTMSDEVTGYEGNRGDVDNNALGGGKKKHTPASKAQTAKADPHCGGLSHPEVPRNGYGDQEDALPPLQKGWAAPSAYRDQGPEDTHSNSAVPRRYAPGPKTSKMSSNKAFVGMKSQRRKEDDSVAMPTASGSPADVLASSQRHSTVPSGQPRSGMPSLLQQGPTASPGQTPFEASASVKRGSAVSYGQFHSAPGHPSESDNSDVMKGLLRFGKNDTTHVSPPSQRDFMPGRRQDTPWIASLVDRASDARREEFATGSKCLSSLHDSATANREEADRLDRAVSNRDKPDSCFTGAPSGDLDLDSLHPALLSTHLSALNRELKRAAERLHRASVRQGERNIKHKDEVTRLKEELSDSRREIKVKDATIAALKEEVVIQKVANDDKQFLMRHLEKNVAELEALQERLRYLGK